MGLYGANLTVKQSRMGAETRDARTGGAKPGRGGNFGLFGGPSAPGEGVYTSPFLMGGTGGNMETSREPLGKGLPCCTAARMRSREDCMPII